jgi:peptidoglycan/LPS O-acetylase OafA/YrhL
MQLNRDHFKVLDSWRGICACMVALSHFSVYNHIYNVPIFWNAGYYVDFFFVLSGFVIFANYQQRLATGFEIGRFVLIRFGRIYPLHFLTLMLFVAYELLQLALPLAGPLSDTNKPFGGPGEGIDAIAINLLLLHSFNLVGAYSFNSPSWSISAEFYTYILFATLMAKFSGWRKVWLTAAIGGGFTFFAFYGGKEATHDGGVLRCIYGFATGGLCWTLWETYKDRVLQRVRAKWLWTALEAVTIALALYLVNALGNTLLVSVTPFVFAALIYVFAFENGVFSKLLAHRFFLLLGALSYSIYMIHTLISWKLISPMIDILKHFSAVQLTTLADGQRRLGVEYWQGDLASVVYLAAVIFASYLSYHYFEVPCRNYFKKRAELSYGVAQTQVESADNNLSPPY